ncbi:MAG: hypothetical protein ABJG41_14840 [Cyclobacteriaceae bacterium]
MSKNTDPILGKLFTLTQIFKEQNPDCDGTELPACIELLNDFCWDVDGVDLLIKLESCSILSAVEIGYYRDMFENVNENNINPNARSKISENEKLDKVAELCGSEIISADHEKVKAIVESLKLEN